MVAIEAEQEAERRRAEAFRELMARPDAEPDPVRIDVQRSSRGFLIAALRRSVSGWLGLVVRRPRRAAHNR